MKNYKDVIMNFFNGGEHEFPTDYHKAGFLLAKNFFELRLKNTLKQYNNDESRAFDLYAAKNNLYLFNIFVEEMYFISQEEVQDKHFIIRSMMRDIHNNLQKEINEWKEHL